MSGQTGLAILMALKQEMAMEDSTVLLDILKSVTRIEMMMQQELSHEKKDAPAETPPDPELFSTILEGLDSYDPEQSMF